MPHSDWTKNFNASVGEIFFQLSSSVVVLWLYLLSQNISSSRVLRPIYELPEKVCHAGMPSPTKMPAVDKLVHHELSPTRRIMYASSNKIETILGK